MRSLLTIFSGLFLLAGSQLALSADADKPIVVAAVHAKQAPKAKPASATASQVTRETSVPEGSLEKFGAVGLPQ